MDFPKRIESLLQALNMNQTALAKALGVSRGIISEFSSGAREPSKDFLFGISKLGISIDWFLSGEGPMFLNEKRNVSYLKSEPDSVLIPSPPTSNGSILTSGRKIQGRKAIEMAIEEVEPEIGFVDFFPAQTVGAGPGREAEAYLETIRLPVMRRFLQPWRPDQIKALEARGDSMTKVGLFDRDIVLYTPEENEGDGIFVISIDGRMQVKRIEFDILGKTLKIISENDRYAARTLTAAEEIDLVKIEGKVVAWLHRHPY